MTTGELIGRIYDLPEPKLLGLAVNLKQHPDWCRENIQDHKAVKAAFEKVLDIRGPERKAVRNFYYKGNQYPAIRSNRELRMAHFLLKNVVEGSETISTALAISLKCTIRAYTKPPETERRIVKDDGGDGYIELIELPALPDLETAEAFFNDRYYLDSPNSAYDCTGLMFTSWYKLFERRGRWWAYHRVSVDV